MLPACLVVAVVSREDVEEGTGIDIVPEPAISGDKIIPGAPVVAGHLGVLTLQLDLDAKIATPHLLDGLSDLAMGFARVEKYLELWKILAAGMAGVSEKLPGARRIER